jgi:hypothetical protein
MILTACLALLISIWSIAIVYMSRPGRSLYVDTAKVFREARQAVARGETIRVGYYRLGRKVDRVQVARQELEEILRRFGNPMALHPEAMHVHFEHLNHYGATNIAVDLMAAEGIEQRIQTLSIECRRVRDVGRRVELEGDPLELAELLAYA